MTQEQVTEQVLSLAQLQAMADEEAEIGLDMSVASAGGGFQAKRFTPGWTLAYYTGYIEKGSHRSRNPKPGEKNEPKPQAQHTFHLLSSGYTNDDGTAYQMDTFDMNISNNEKAGAFLMFKAMNWRGDKKRFPQLLGGLYLIEIVDYLPKTAKPGQEPKSIINVKSIAPAIERITGAPYTAPLPLNEAWLKLFMWEKPHLAGWKSLYIDGVNDTTKQSKNWIQETIAGATNFAGSPLEIMLRSSGQPVPAARVAAPAVAAPVAGVAPPAAGVAPPAGVVAPNVAPTPVSSAPVIAPVAPVAVVSPQPVAVTPVVSPAPAVGVTPSVVAPTPVVVSVVAPVVDLVAALAPEPVDVVLPVTP